MVYDFEELNTQDKELLLTARKACNLSHSPSRSK